MTQWIGRLLNKILIIAEKQVHKIYHKKILKEKG